MLVDLSTVGAAYMYAVVDAYDRRIAEDLAGKPASLLPIRGRLLDLFPTGGAAGAASSEASAPGNWVHLLGRRAVIGPTPGASSEASEQPGRGS